MPLVSTLELPGSPTELLSHSPQTTFYWDPTAELASGETATSPTCTVYQYDPAYPNDSQVVTASVLAVNPPALGSGGHAGQVQVVVAAASMKAGYEYRFELAASGSLGTNPSRFFRIRCLY